METENAPPPGLDSGLVKLFSGGDTANWRELKRFKPFTNVFVLDKERGRILLGMKKRGFGKGLFNGFGGKIEPDETLMQAAVRELKEEAGISADLEECGILLFVNAATEYCPYVRVYRAHEYEGEPIETEEMHPHWFAIPQEALKTDRESQEVSREVAVSVPSSSVSLPGIPFNQMWPDAELWMPLLLKGQYFVGRADFGVKNDDAQYVDWTMERWWFGTKA